MAQWVGNTRILKTQWNIVPLRAHHKARGRQNVHETGDSPRSNHSKNGDAFMGAPTKQPLE